MNKCVLVIVWRAVQDSRGGYCRGGQGAGGRYHEKGRCRVSVQGGCGEGAPREILESLVVEAAAGLCGGSLW